MNKMNLNYIKCLTIFELENSKSIDLEILKTQYKKLYKKYHPDLTIFDEYKDGRKLQELVKAYKYLKENVEQINAIISKSEYTEENINKAQEIISQEQVEKQEKQKVLKKHYEELEAKKQEEIKLRKIKQQEEWEVKKRELEKENIKIKDYKREQELKQRKEYITERLHERRNQLDIKNYSRKNYHLICKKIDSFLKKINSYSNVDLLSKDYTKLVEYIENIQTRSLKKNSTRRLKKVAVLVLIVALLIGVVRFLPSLIDTDAIIQESQELLKQGEYDKAENKLSKLDTDEAKTLLEQIDIYKCLNEGDFDKALELFEKIGSTNIDYNTDGGILNNEELMDYLYNSYSTCVKEGYTFEKWKLSDYDIDFSKLDVELEAVYSLIDYMINYDLNGGKFDSNFPEKYTIESEKLSIPNPQKEGYEFLGWAVAGISQLISNYEILENSTGDISLEAIWASKKVTYIFDTNGGNKISSKTYDVGSTITLPIPVKKGYHFEGWLLNENIIPNTFTCTTAEEPITLIAKWSKVYNITLYDGEKEVFNKDVFVNEYVEIPKMSKNGYTFMGWYNKNNQKINLESGYINTEDNIIAYAKWAALTYNVSFKTNSEECSYESKKVVYDSYVTLPVPTKSGYTFLGWYYKNNKVSDGVWKINENCTLEGKWAKTSHSHSYVSTVVSSSCLEKGYTIYTCSCGASYKDKYTLALGHDYGSWKVIKEATETSTGIKERTCSRCNDKNQEVLPKLNHIHKYIPKVINPTCLEKGYTIYTCSCGDFYKSTYTDTSDHCYELAIVLREATCQLIGVAKYECIYCKNEIYNPIPMTNHNYIYQESKNLYICGYCGLESTTNSTIKELKDAAASLGDKEYLEGEFTVTGKVTEITAEYSEQYKNISFMLSDGVASILVYRTKGDEAANVKVGDTVTLTGKVQNYGGTIEIVNGLISARVAGER